MTYEELRDVWEHSTVLRTMVRNVCWTVWCNCGSEENVESHHIVPLKLGGTNSTSNIAALCNRCHKSAHYGRHIRDYQNKKITGRPSREIDEEVLDMFVNCIIGTREYKKLCGIPNATKIKDTSAFKKYKEKNGIDKARNYIDVIEKKCGYVEEGREVGFIKYKNGTVKTIRYGA